VCVCVCVRVCVRAGTHKVDVTYEGLNVPRSPFSVNVVPGCDPSRVRAYGPGTSHFHADRCMSTVFV